MVTVGDRGCRITGGGATILESANPGLVDEFKVEFVARAWTSATHAPPRSAGS